MSINAIGKCCGNLCEKFAFTFNCSKNNNIIIVGVGSLGNTVDSLIESGDNGLMEAVTKLQGEQPATLKTKTVRRLNREDRQVDAKGICQGIIETTADLCNKLTIVNEPSSRGWQKLRLAQADCEIDLEEKLKNKEALTGRELMQLTKSMKKVSQYYLTAIFLWKMGKQRNFKKDRLETVSKDVSKCMKYLQKNLFSAERKRLREVEDFFLLDRNLQLIYIDAACLAPATLRMALLANATLTPNADVLPCEGSSQLHNRVLQLRSHPSEPFELKRMGSDGDGDLTLRRRRHVIAPSMGSAVPENPVPEDTLSENSSLVVGNGNHSPVD